MISNIPITIWHTYLSKSTSINVNTSYTYGLPFMSLGLLFGIRLRDNKCQNKTLKPRKCLICFFSLVVCLAIEGFFATIVLKVVNRTFFIFTLPGLIALFCFTYACTLGTDKLSCLVSRFKIREFSTLIYLTHGWVMVFLSRTLNITEGILFFCSVLFIDIIISLIIILLTKKYKFIKYFY